MKTRRTSEVLTVVIAGQSIGEVRVRDRTSKKVRGHFAPNANFAPYRATFEAAVELAREYDATVQRQLIDDPLWDRLMAAYERITRLNPTLAEIPSPIEAFEIAADWAVEITLG